MGRSNQKHLRPSDRSKPLGLRFPTLFCILPVFVSVETAAILFGPAGIGVFLTALGGLILPHLGCFALIDLFPLLPVHPLPWNRHKTRVDDLPSPCGVAGFPQKSMEGREQSLRQFGLGQ